VAAVLGAGGTLLFAAAPPTRARRAPAPGTGPRDGAAGAFSLGPLRAPGLRTLFVTAVGLGVSFGAVDVALPAFGVEQGSPSAGAATIAALAVGSGIGGFAYGALAHGRVVRWYLAAATAVPLGLAALCLADGVLAMLALAPFAGAALAPLTAAENELAGTVAGAGEVSEAYAWVITATVVGYSAGTGASGVLVDAAGWRAALLAGAGVALVGTAAAFARRATLAPRPAGAA